MIPLLVEYKDILGLLLALVAIVVAIIIAVATHKANKKKSELKIGFIEHPNLCSTFTVGCDDHGNAMHRTAFMVYLELTNIGSKPLQISKINLGYKSEANNDPEAYRWLTRETIMLSDYFHGNENGEIVKVIPFLRQKNYTIPNDTRNYLEPGAYSSGLVYFEQEQSSGDDYPYMDEDCYVHVLVKVFDTNLECWSAEYRIPKVRVGAIRERNPDFGTSSDRMGAL